MEIPRRWEKIETRGENYTPRTGHTVVENNGDLYLFAGADSDSRTNDLYLYSIEHKKWFKLNPKGDSKPIARSGAHSLSYQESIYIFGGYTRKGGDYFNDINEYKTVEDEWVDLKALNPPAPRTDHTFVRYKDAFYLYGGRDEMRIFADIHEYKINQNTWKELKTRSQPSQIYDNMQVLQEPKLRFGHTAVMNKQCMHVFGGWDGNVTLNDLNTYDIEQNVWFVLTNVKGQIKGRYRHSATATSTCMYIFGGIDQFQERFNDICEFTFDTQSWTRVITIGNSPTTRTFHQCVIYTGYLYVLGGFDGMKRNDMYRILIDQNAQQDLFINISQDSLNNSQLDQSISISSRKDNLIQSQREPLEEKKTQYFNDEYFNNMSIGQWIKIRSLGDNYSPRTGHECIFYQDMIYLFGGTDDNDRKNDLYQYDIHSNSWEKLLAQGQLPIPRSGAKGIAYKNCLYFFGGYQKKSSDYYNDLFYYDLSRKRWVAIEKIGDYPSERTDHTLVLYEGSIYVYGGYDGKSRFGDLYKCNLKSGKYTWKELKGDGIMPLNRFGHTAIVYEHSMFVFGGWNGHDTMDDIYQYSFPSNYWYEIKRVKGIRPQPRYRHSAVICNNTMIIFGGVDTDQKRFNDLFTYEIEKRKWTLIQTNGTPPQPRTFHRTVMFGNVMYVIGGFDGSRLNDIHHVAMPSSLYEEDSDSMRRISRPASSASGIMQTVPSDLPIGGNCNAKDDKGNDINYLKKQIELLKRQVKELSTLLKQEEENMDACKICYARDIDTVFLECAHRVVCVRCSQSIVKCPICRMDIRSIIKTYNV